jgi:ABC-type multidrug transport system fused ATPase/permease subunit
VLVLASGGWAVMGGTMAPHELLKFFLYLALFYEPVGRLHSLNQLILSARASADRVFAILDAADEPDSTTGKDLPRPVRGHLRFERVTFAYAQQPVLREISLEALPGQTIALVGATGAGKSTVVNLIARFYEYDGGSLTLDGHELNTLRKPSLREVIGYVSQDPFLFNGSVRENLVLAKRTAGEADIWDALEAAHAAEFVRGLPQGLDTNVGERGVKLSGGERQRLSIARALLKNAPLLLLDEATAAVDSETERLIQEALDRLMCGRTAVVIAHRLSTIQNADRIYVLDGGRVIEEGTHVELSNAGGKYAELCRKSFLAETGEG